jgi:DNA/RNA endonuclease YhcR with UshA esterase domain
MRSQLGEFVELLDVVEVKGEVTVYRGELEVIPSEAGDIRIIRTAPLRISSLSEDNAGVPVKVQGVVAEREIVGNGSVIFTLRDDGAELPVFVPRWIVEDGIPEVHVGTLVRIGGWLQLYEGELELKVTSASNIRPVEAD